MQRKKKKNFDQSTESLANGRVGHLAFVEIQHLQFEQGNVIIQNLKIMAEIVLVIPSKWNRASTPIAGKESSSNIMLAIFTFLSKLCKA